MPDIVILYKLQQECPKLINLYELLHVFAEILEPGRLDATPPDEIVQARFLQAVLELQMLGFVQPTRRKTDHVQRLTW